MKATSAREQQAHAGAHRVRKRKLKRKHVRILHTRYDHCVPQIDLEEASRFSRRPLPRSSPSSQNPSHPDHYHDAGHANQCLAPRASCPLLYQASQPLLSHLRNYPDIPLSTGLPSQELARVFITFLSDEADTSACRAAARPPRFFRLGRQGRICRNQR